MSHANDFNPITDFFRDLSSERSTVNTRLLNDEFKGVSTSVNKIIANQKLIQRDDGKLKDKLIEPFMLNDEVKKLFGVKGDKGDIGLVGPQGLQGVQGVNGDKGLTGDQGPQGLMGPQGVVGPIGIKGDAGPQGVQGIQGLKGDKGDTGPQGTQGTQGIKGDTGTQGQIGSTGPKGDIGLQGAQGTQGIQGIQGVKGDAGDVADKVDRDNAFVSVSGATGQSIGGSFTTLQMGTVTSGAANYNATSWLYTVPVTGIYLITGLLRIADSSLKDTQFGVGVHTSNTDGSWFLWHTVQASTSGLNRTTYPYIRQEKFTAGQQLRMFSYVDTGSLTVFMAAMQVSLLLKTP